MNPETKAKIALSIKKNRLIRIMVYPFMTYKREKVKKTFWNSQDGAYLRTLKDKFRGKRCFIVGNGPSLTLEDLNRIKNEYSFGTNKILYLLDKCEWIPTFYLCIDDEAGTMIKTLLHQCNVPYKFINIGCRSKDDPEDFHYVYTYTKFTFAKYAPKKPEISEDISSYIWPGCTVTFAAIQMAIYMGFKEIYLIGVDHSYSVTIDRKGHKKVENAVKTYADGIPDWGKSVQYIDATTEAYQCAKDYCDTHGIKIYNATRGGKLEVFERVDIDDLL